MSFGLSQRRKKKEVFIPSNANAALQPLAEGVNGSGDRAGATVGFSACPVVLFDVLSDLARGLGPEPEKIPISCNETRFRSTNADIEEPISFRSGIRDNKAIDVINFVDAIFEIVA